MKLLRSSALLLVAFSTYSLWGQLSAPAPAQKNVIAVVDTKGSPGFTSLRLDSAGNPVISYSTATKTLYYLRVAHCGNATCTAGNVIATGDKRFVERNTSLALNNVGNPVVAYYYGDAELGMSRLKLLFCQDANCASNTTQTADSQGETGIEPSVVIDGAGSPVISYATLGSLRLLHCGDAACSANNSDLTVGPGSPFTGALALDSSGNPVIAMENGGQLALEHCGDANCSAGNSAEFNLGDLGLLGVFAQSGLALDATGHPVITYLYQGSGSAGSLHVLHCGNPNCSSGNVDTDVDDYAGNQTVSSLVLDAEGNPVISYSTGSLVLAVLHCGNANCSSGNTLALPDLQGLWSSIVLDSKGNPVVSYATITTPYQLRVLHCATSTCD